MDELERTILAAILDLARRRDPGLTEVRRDQALAVELGLESLDIAELAAILELRLGDDPFARGSSLVNVRTVGDLIALYTASKGS